MNNLLSNKLNMTAKKKLTLFFLFLTLLLVVGVFRFLLQGKLLVSDDYEHHAARTANYYLALKQDQLPPRWAPNLNGGYGYPAFFYTYHLPYAAASVVHSLGISIQQSLNLTVLLWLAIGSGGAFLLSKQEKLSDLASLAVGLFFVINPYMMLNVYWRGALGEIAFYALLPVLFLGLQPILKNRAAFASRAGWQRHSGAILLTVLALIGLVLSHLLSVAVLAPIITAYILLVVFAGDRKPAKQKLIFLTPFVAAAALAMATTAWYWMPAIFERSLIVFDSSRLADIYQDHLISPAAIFSFFRTIDSSEYFLEVLQIGPAVILAATAVFLAIYQKTKMKLLTAFWAVVLAAAVFLGTNLSQPWWEAIFALRTQQFPWKFLWVANLAIFWLLLFGFKLLPKKKRLVAALVLIVITAWSALAYAQPKGYASREDFDWYQSVATGSSFDEFRPVWSKQDYGLEEPVRLLGEGTIEVNTWTGSYMNYSVDAQAPTKVVQKTLYFPGWQVFLDDFPIELDPADAEFPGLIVIPIPEGKHHIEASFSGSTPIRNWGNYLSWLGLGLIGVIVIKVLYNE